MYVSSSIEFCKKYEDQDKYIAKLQLSLEGDVNIDFKFRHNNIHGTVLTHAIKCGFDQIVRYALKKGASITTEIQLNSSEFFRCKNAIEMVKICKTSNSTSSDMKIFEMLKEKSLELFSSYGITSFHIDCAAYPRIWRFILDPDGPELNASIDIDSPLWAGMTPLLIAAKCNSLENVDELLESGALSNARDPRGNTPLHYVLCHNSIDDIRSDFNKPWIFRELFVMDGSDTFDTLTGESHFHIACRLCPETFDIVEKYLKQGISANLQTKTADDWKDDFYPSGKTGLHIAASQCVYPYPKLVQLLIEYGADVELEDENGNTAIEYFFCHRYFTYDDDRVECICLLLESGAEYKVGGDLYAFKKSVNASVHQRLCILESIKKTYMINGAFSSEALEKLYKYLLNDDFGEIEYEKFCLEELSALSECGLRQILEETIMKRDTIIKRDLKEKLEAHIDAADPLPKLYPVYGNMLKIQIKRKLFLHKQKRQKINEAIPSLQLIFQNLWIIPDLVAENILWNFSAKDIDKLIL